MSTALAIAAVTHVLRDLLNDGFINREVAGAMGSTVSVTALPPDRIVPAAGGGEATKLNLFLRLVTPNLGWQNQDLPARDPSGQRRLSNPPLALDLHYIISAHGSEDLHAEIVLGHAMLLLHENAIIPRESIRTSLQPPLNLGPVLPPALKALATSGLENQAEQLKISPEYLNSEEISKFWTATQSHYRPCAAYVVSVVLIQKPEPTKATLPVLERRGHVRPDLVAPFPMLESVVPEASQPAATLGTTIKLKGRHLGSGPGRKVLLVNDRLLVKGMRDATDSADGGGVEFDIPDSSSGDFPAGIYRVSVRLPAGGGTSQETNQLALILAPKVTSFTTPVTPVLGKSTISVDFLPAVRPEQTARLVLGQRECEPKPFTTEVTTLTFVVDDLASGFHQLRLRIDGIDSALLDLEPSPPAFNNQRIEIQ